MNVDINTPQITLLRQKVEEISGITPRLLSDFELLAEQICRKRERLSQSTLERLWQYSTRRKNTVSEHTLNVLARYVGYADWAAFSADACAMAHPESGYFSDGILDIGNLRPGALLRLAWLPDRKITVRYLGNRRFEVMESLNSSIQPGDTFECTQVQVGQPLYLDRFLRAGAVDDGHNARYVVGRDSGLTSAQVLEECPET